MDARENWVRSSNNLQRLQLAILGNGNETPVVEAALPELAEVYLDFEHHVVLVNYVPWFDLMPG